MNKEKQYYTYLYLREDGTPYYVGKGQGNRAYAKHRTGPPIDHARILIQNHPSEQDAFAAEAFLIAYYGRKDNGTGILRNLTDGGDQPSIEMCSKGGKIGGGIAKARGQISALRCGCRKGGKATGHINGMKNVASGHLDRIRLLITPELRFKTSQSVGRKNVESGHLERIRALIDPVAAGKRAKQLGLEWGGINGHKQASSGHLTQISPLANHTRWHVNRGLVKAGCPLCSL